ncbi:MAG: ABC transporter substrate-binding protein [Magnetococcales bacterium]|nr:ABC transporter substrate-binding protein [Magnetococcales bacterium]
MADHPPTKIRLTLSPIRLMLGALSLLLADAVFAAPDTNSPYINYSYGPATEWIDIGIQPLWLPSSLITETMRRDVLLRQELAARGKGIRFHPFLNGPDINTLLHEGRLVAGVGGDLPALRACIRDRVQVLSLMDLSFTAVVAREALLPTDLRGLRIGYVPGSNAHYTLLKTLDAAAIPESDVQLVETPINRMPGYLQSKRIDAFAAWEPIPSLATSQRAGQVVFRHLSRGYLYFADAFATNHPHLVDSLLASQIRALNWLKRSEANQGKALDWALTAAQELTGLQAPPDRDELRILAYQGLRRLGSIPVVTTQESGETGYLARLFAFLRGIGQVPDSLTWNQVAPCFQKTVLQKILADPVTHRLRQDSFRPEDPS